MELVGMDDPLTCLKVSSKGRDPDTTFSVIPYYKGAFLIKEFEYLVGRERFDAFVQKYTHTYRFQSLTTEAFLDFLKSELPEVFEKVNVREWVYEPGLPDIRHKPQSDLYDEAQEVLRAYKAGTRPMGEQVADWHRYQILSFLQALPKQISVEDCKHFEQIFELESKNDGGHYSYFYAVCIYSGYEEILPQIEEFIGRIGRLIYIKPIFLAMIATDWARPHARRILEGVRERHHKITVHVVDKLLKDAGL